jgi:hypothetical protein
MGYEQGVGTGIDNAMYGTYTPNQEQAGKNAEFIQGYNDGYDDGYASIEPIPVG